jgi:AraC-like DNA-binding protein
MFTGRVRAQDGTMTTHLHSIPARDGIGPCEVTARLAHPRLRQYVVGYGGFRSACGTVVPHRVLPLNLVTVIIELDGTLRLVTGPRLVPSLFERTVWGGGGVSIGLTPAGAFELLGTRMRDLVHADVPLADLLGRRDAELAERLASAPDWPTRFAVLDERLTAWLGAVRGQPDELTPHAWRRLQDPDRPRISALASETGISRRALETRFQRTIGLAPAAVARIARFQRAVGMLARRSDLSRIALDCGYADQPHFNRDVRAMTGLTPTRLCAFLQYRELSAR